MIQPSPSSKKPAKSWWRSIRLWPQSLAGQLIAALLLALIVSQAISIYIFASERIDVARDAARGQVLARTASVVRLLNQTDADLHRRVLQAAEGSGIRYALVAQTQLTLPNAGTPEAFLAQRLEKRAGLPEQSVRIRPLDMKFLAKMRKFREMRRKEFLKRKRDRDRDREDADDDDDRDGHHWHDDRKSGKRDDHYRSFRKGHKRPPLHALDMKLAIPLENGQWLQVRTGIPDKPAKWGIAFLSSMLVMAVMMMLVVILTVRKLTAPLRALANASRQLGRGEATEPLEEKGPKEIRNTVAAFNNMQERLMRFVQDRTRMLAAISHDLRTPITTLRLRAEFIDDEEMRGKILDTLEEMQAMTEAVLAFAREDASNEETREVDLSALASSMAEDFSELGKDVRFLGDDAIVYACRPISLKRALRNLIENALRYAGAAEIKVVKGVDGLQISVLDQGPGIPAEKLEEVFSPFFRVEGSRNLETGGVGLGLSITRTIIRSHGGDVTLANRKDGGLEATINLPNI